MIKGDREIGVGDEEREIPCHFLFDLTVDNTSAYSLQVESVDLIPKGAKNIRPIFEGSIVQETYNLATPDNPKPLRRIHTHEGEEGKMSGLGFRWATTRDEYLKGLDALIFVLKHPIHRE